MNTEPPVDLAAQAAWADKLDFDDPQTAPSDRDKAICALLIRRLNAVAQPSVEINLLYEAHTSGRALAKVLNGLIGRAPRVLGIIRGALREAFALDPDTVLFTEPRPPAVAQKVDSLTERALASLIQPYVPLNINQFTSLSIKGDPSCTLPFTARDALVRVKGLALLGRLETTEREYWQQLAHGSWLTRKQHWIELRTSLFAENALLAHRLYQLTDSGFAMVRKLMQIPGAGARQRAGGEWSCIQVSRIAWPGTHQALVSIPGALHIYRDGVVGDTPHVIYLPGLFREFYEFSSWERLQCELPILVNGPLSRILWQCLPLRRWNELCGTASATPMTFTLQRIGMQQDDALQASATQLLEAQWDNELACALSINHAAVGIQGAGQSAAPDIKRFLKFIEKGRARLVGPSRLGTTLDTLLEWDRNRRDGEIVCGRFGPQLALRTQQAQLDRYQKGLMTLLDAKDVANDSTVYQDFLSLERRWQEQVDAAQKWAQGPPLRVVEKAYWLERPEGSLKRGSLLMAAQQKAMCYEAQMQQRLNLMTGAHLERLEQALSQAWRPGRSATDTCVLKIAVGSEATTLYPLLGAYVVTSIEARTQPADQQAVVLCVTGRDGGLVAFDNLNAVTEGLQASLKSQDGSVLWSCIGRQQRESARAVVAALTKSARVVVSYEAIERPLFKDLFVERLKQHVELDKLIDQGVRLFSEVSDPQLSRLLSAQELFESLQVPANDARALALSNINLLQTAAKQAKKLPSWLGIASPDKRKHYKRLSHRYLASAWAVESKLWQDLPDLESFARTALVAQLTQDGLYPQLDIDKPLFDMPDDVSAHYDGWSSVSVPGDRQIRKNVSKQRTTFSLLQLALHNLDPKAPWSRWRLNRAVWLEPDWKERLSVHYLIKLISSLDVGGEYDKLIQRAFYSPASTQAASTGLSQALVYRALQQRAEMQLYSAVQQGLSEKAQRLFNVAMAARSASDLKADGFEVQLAVLRLVGINLKQDRHIAGVLFIHDKLSGLCVLYWPAAEESPEIVGYASLNKAVDAMNLLGAQPGNLKGLARQVAPGWEAQALAGYHGEDLQVSPRLRDSSQPDYQPILYRLVFQLVEFFMVKHNVPEVDQERVESQIKDQIALHPQGWLQAATTSCANAMALLAHAQVLDLQRRTQARSQSSQALEEYREERLGEQRDATIRGLLSFIPILGTGISLYEMLLAARRYHFSGSGNDAVEVGFLTIMAFIDVVSTFVPGPKGARFARGALAKLHRVQGVPAAAICGLKALPSKSVGLLTHFKSSGALAGAVELKGPGGKGLHVKNGQQFIVEGDEAYTVYQRQNERGFRLKHPQVDGQDELILNIHQSREWLLGADAPQPGPSSGVHNPWRAPRSPTPDWQPPDLRRTTEPRILQSRPTNQRWLEWRTQLQPTQIVSSPAPEIFEVGTAPGGSGLNARFLRVAPPNIGIQDSNSGFYRLLPQGDNAPSTSIVFITRNEPLSSSAGADIVRWTSTDIGDQPVPVSRTPTGGWQNHPALFDRPLEQYVGEAFPTMTRETQEFTVRRLIELTGPSHQVTAGHMLGIRATLDDWLPSDPARRGRTDDLLRMLRPIPRGYSSTLVSYQGAAPGFERVDFLPPVTLQPRLQRAGKPVAADVVADRNSAQRAAVRIVLERQGFTVQDFQVKRHRARATIESIATHPNSPGRIYYLAYEWLQMGNVYLKTKFQNAWFYVGFRSYESSALATRVSGALHENRLVRILTGIQWPIKGVISPTVYFIKVAPSP